MQYCLPIKEKPLPNYYKKDCKWSINLVCNSVSLRWVSNERSNGSSIFNSSQKCIQLNL